MYLKQLDMLFTTKAIIVPISALCPSGFRTFFALQSPSAVKFSLTSVISKACEGIDWCYGVNLFDSLS